MAIQVELNKVLKSRNMTSKKLSKIIGITEANLSILRSGKAKAIRFTTLASICKALDCQPSDFIKYLDE